MLTLIEGQFYDADKGKALGVTATQKRGRWFYRDADNGNLYASGMTPERFAKKFWYRDDFTAAEAGA